MFSKLPEFGPPTYVGDIGTRSLNEISGIKACSFDEELLWAQEDETSNLYAIDVRGNLMAKVKIDLGDNFDKDGFDGEELSAFTRDGKRFLLFADIGNNNKDGRKDFHIICLEEPRPNDGEFQESIEPVWILRYRYEDDKSVNAEALAVDQARSEILILRKRSDNDRSMQIYSLPLVKESTDDVTAKFIGKSRQILNATEDDTPQKSQPTAMDISEDGRLAVVLTYSHAYAFYRSDEETWQEAFVNNQPTKIRLPYMRQSESICFDQREQSIFVTSERGGKKKRAAPVFRIDIRP